MNIFKWFRRDDSGDIVEVFISKIVISVLLFVVTLVFLFGSFVVIGAGQRGVIMTWGKVDMNTIWGEGLHLKWPIAQSVHKINVQVTKSETKAAAATMDLQDIHTTIALNFHPVPEEVNWLYQQVGVAYETRVIDPAIQEVVKSVTAAFKAEEAIQLRETIRTKMEAELRERLRQFKIIVDAMAIVNFEFSPNFTTAIENKQIAEQQSLEEKNRAEKAKWIAEQQIQEARGVAESYKLKNRELTDLLLREKFLSTWDGKLPEVISEDGLKLLLNYGNK